jgi:hypothetical protein
MMAYNVIQPPFSLKFRQMPQDELHGYLKRFLEIIPDRIKELADAVKESSGFEDWEPDFTPDSLRPLGVWFAAQVQIRRKTRHERQEIESHLAFPIQVEEWQLTDQTLSIAFDIGMYFSQILLQNYSSLRWEHLLNATAITDGGKTSRFHADYGQPVLAGFGTVRLNPIRIATTLACGLARKSQSGERLYELYQYWSGLAMAKP